MSSIYLYAYGLSGGNGLNIVRIANYLLSQGWDVSLIYNKFDERCMSSCREGLTHHKLKDEGLIRSVFQIRRLLKKTPTPSVYFVSGGSYAFAFYIATKMAFKETSFVIRECVSPSLMIPSTSKLFKFKKKMLAVVYNRADKLIAITKAMQKDMVNNFNADSAKVSVIYNGVELSRQSPGADEIGDESIATSDNKIRLLNVGRLVEQKNHTLLLNAFAKLSHNYLLSIVGEGPLLSTLEKQALELGINDRVVFHGYQKNVSAFYEKSDIFVLSSNFEGFPNVLVEALSHGCQIVSTDCPTGPNEILEGGRFGLLVPCGDADKLATAIKDIATHSPLKDTLKNKSYEFTVLRQVEAFDRVLSEINKNREGAL